jgi:hypothetical protein
MKITGNMFKGNKKFELLIIKLEIKSEFPISLKMIKNVEKFAFYLLFKPEKCVLC